MPADTERGGLSALVTSQQPPGSEFTRLHITPLDADLVKTVVPASVLPSARNISYHTIETFPEKRYGFVDLPRADADKLKAKLNGAVLKGVKMRIEKARPETKMELPVKEEKKGKRSKDKSDGSRKRKREDKVVEGVALTDRQVKRGWTETPDEKAKRKKKEKSEKSSKDKKEKKRTKSKYTEQGECLLKTKLPPNASKNVPEDDVSRKKKRKKGNSREATVHEFEKTTKFPSFLKDAESGSSRSKAAEFVEGSGWVDEEGNVVEAVKPKRPPPTKSVAKKKPAVEEDDDDTSSSGTSSSGTSDVSDDSDTSSDSSSDEEDVHNSVKNATPASKDKADRPTSSASSQNLKVKIPPPATPSSDKIHPLEALYKRHKPDENATEAPAQQSEAFSFFDADNEEEDEEPDKQAAAMPMTPFTRQDYELRNIRSAAPTPDTAHPSRMQNTWSYQHDDDVDDDAGSMEEDEDEGNGEPTINRNNAASDFQTWFWEHRRDLNQSWMKRRKTAAKEKRHRENRARASRAV